MTMNRREVLARTVATVAGAGSPTGDAAADLPPMQAKEPRTRFADPGDDYFFRNLEFVEEQIHKLKILFAAAADQPRIKGGIRDCALLSLRLELFSATSVMNDINECACQQAVELHPLRAGRYPADGWAIRERAAYALHGAGFSWSEAAEILYDEEDQARRFAAAMEERSADEHHLIEKRRRLHRIFVRIEEKARAERGYTLPLSET